MSRPAQILIAGDDQRRAVRLAEACGARGYSTAFARHGAAALEVALGDVPDILVAPVDLELIEAPKLAEILRANPRTQAVRVLFLGHDQSAARERGYFDDTISLGAGAEDIALRIEAMLAQRDRIDAVQREADAEQEVQGKLAQIPLTDLLQLFHMNRRTGTIELVRTEAAGREERGALVLRDGNLIQATTGRVDGEKALFRLLAWSEGSFAFTPGPVTMAPRIVTPTRALLMEAMRQIDEWDRVKESLPALSGRARLALPQGDVPNAVHPVTQEVLGLLEHHEEIRDLLDQSRYPDYQLLRTLQTLAERGWIELLRDGTRGEEGPDEGLFDAAGQRRLREWLQASRPRDMAVGDAKLLLAAADPGSARDFVSLLGALPGMRLEPEIAKGAFRGDDLLSVGRLKVDEGIGIEILHVPTAPEFAACWPALAQGALGTLLLVSQPVRDREESLRPLIETLSRSAPVRLFHVVLLRKGERLAREEVQASVSLLDESSLFLVPLEEDREPSSLLRTMLARVLP